MIIVLAIVAAPQYVPAADDDPDPDPEKEKGWEKGRMSDRAKDCQKPGLGRPWCR